MGLNSERHREEVEATEALQGQIDHSHLSNFVDALHYRTKKAALKNRTIQNKDADDLKTVELMLEQSLKFEEAQQLIKDLLDIIESDRIGKFAAKTFPHPDEIEEVKPHIKKVIRAMQFVNVISNNQKFAKLIESFK